MDKKQTNNLGRLVLGFALNVALYMLMDRASKWGGIDREFHLSLFAASLAVPTLVVVLPVFWRGLYWQAPLALLLLPFPAKAIFSAFLLLQKH